MSLREEKERAVTYQEFRHAEGTPTGKAQAPVDRRGLQDARVGGQESEGGGRGLTRTHARGMEKLQRSVSRGEVTAGDR